MIRLLWAVSEQVFWPDDGTWWPGTVTALNLKKLDMTLLYDTGADMLLMLSLPNRALPQMLAWSGQSDWLSHCCLGVRALYAVQSSCAPFGSESGPPEGCRHRFSKVDFCVISSTLHKRQLEAQGHCRNFMHSLQLMTLPNRL